MGITGAFILFIVFIVFYMLIAEIFTVFFRLTGLTDEKARFQVISLLTNSGFTTNESELVTSSKIRRTLARLTMLFGYSFTVTIVSVLVNLFISLPSWRLQHFWLVALAAVLWFTMFHLAKRYSRLRQMLDELILKAGNKLMFGSSSNPVLILDSYADNVIAQIQITHLPRFLSNISLGSSGLRGRYKIQILLIKRDGNQLASINGHTVLQPNDIIVAFGSHKDIRYLFENPAQSGL